MKLLRGVGAMITFIVGLFALAGGLLGMALTWAFAAQTHQPIDLAALADGVVACAIGIAFFWIARVIDPEHGPVLSYRTRRRKSRMQS